MSGGFRLHSCLWELTLRCNMRCRHCGSAAGRARARELTLAECLGVADELARLGCAELGLIGGEIFLYPGWERVARRAADQGLAVNLMTNAYALDEAEVERIRYARLTNVGVSVDGMEETHDRIRRKGSFARVARALDLLRERGIAAGAVTSLLAANLADLEPLYLFLLDHGVSLWQLQLVNPMGNMAGKRELLVAPERIPRLIEFIRERNRERRMTVVAADSIGYYHEDSEEHIRGRRGLLSVWEGCQAGLSALFIDSVGNVKGCGALYDEAFIEGNVRERPLADIWEDAGRFAYNRAFRLSSLKGPCRGCDVADVCRGGCRASNHFTLGSLYENAFCQRNRPPCPSPLSVFAGSDPAPRLS